MSRWNLTDYHSIRGGSILLLHSTPSYTTEETRNKPYALLVALSEATGTATGTAIIDDGISLSTSSLDVAFTASKSSLKGSVSTSSYNPKQPLSNITVLGISSKPNAIKLGGKDIKVWTYESRLQRLNVTGLDILLHQPWQITWA